MTSSTEWLEEPGVEFWKAEYKFEWTFPQCTRELLEKSPVKLLSKPFGDNRWQISVGTIAKTPGYLGVFLGAAQDTELKTSKTWIRRCETCTATLGTPNKPGTYGKDKNISGGYTFNAGLESRRGQAKYIKLEKLFQDPAFILEQALFVEVTLSERRRTTDPSPFGDITRFAGSSARFSNLFDDPDCSDVCFVFPKRKGKRGTRTIYAQKSIIRSVPYFNIMFESGFLESTDALSQADSVDMDGMSLSPTLPCPTEFGEDKPLLPCLFDGVDEAPVIAEDEDSLMDDSTIQGGCDEDDSDFELDDLEDSVRGVQQAADHLTLADVTNPSDVQQLPPTKKRRFSELDSKPLMSDDLPRKGIHRIVITSSPYTTYRALLLYIYSNSIAWAPLRSNWLVVKERIETKGRGVVPRRNVFVREQAVKFSLALTMNELQPTSPKSMYVLADMLQLLELKQEALEQFKRSLSVENVCLELASSFVGKYDDARKLTFEFLRNNSTVTKMTSFMRLLSDGLKSLSVNVQTDFSALMSTLTVPPAPKPSST
ncbi:hypothetical protein CROQUDRAFT_665152 [Cronartium quercuum f. sp. fusiforme G11]|uniref:MATH domain-containing protein n=1 Tax=Cronartium quercuum f. sp. fusiforme G11 TaxID=708437 RepID=A0A9P6T6I8_9BASI|nr:hypothetical protein CROQUDRAFT_665152 [Cronartium quercuum f. sp. fusiforme G11]